MRTFAGVPSGPAASRTRRYRSSRSRSTIPGPSRRWASDAGVDTWLQGVYAANDVNALMAEADAAAVLNGAAAIQVEPTGDPDRPARLWLWRAPELAVFCRGGDPANPWAVCLKDKLPEPSGRLIRTRYRLWSATERATFLTEPYDDATTAGGRRADTFVDPGPHPCPGILPFVFVRAKPASIVSSFWEGGIGCALTDVNLELDRALSDLAQHVAEFLNPQRFARNVKVGTRFYDRVGSYLQLTPTTAQRTGDVKSEPDVFLLQAQLGVQQGWEDALQTAGLALEELGIPYTPVAVGGMTSSGDLSGTALLLKNHVPLAKRTRRRQLQLTEAERDLASTTVAVVGTRHGNERLRGRRERPGRAGRHLARAADPLADSRARRVRSQRAGSRLDGPDRAAGPSAGHHDRPGPGDGRRNRRPTGRVERPERDRRSAPR